MEANNRKSKARQKFLPLQKPCSDGRSRAAERGEWLNEVCRGFVQPSEANKRYYRVLLERLWPIGHGVPGPLVTEKDLRSAIDAYRRKEFKGPGEYSPYIDVFRRMRELQGEEGVVGIAREGKTYQLVDLKLGAKRIPRIGLSDSDWEIVKQRHNYACANCGKKEPDVRLQQDHKIPRVRGGGDELENWQPLCDECNNFKSMSCRGCTLPCVSCGWAFPGKFSPLRVLGHNISAIRKLAAKRGEDPHVLINKILEQGLKQI